MSETHTYQQVIPYTDRLNYCSAIINNVGYCMAVEKLLGIEVPARAQHIRLMLSEFMRIADHLVCIGTNLVDMGALTNFWYLFQPREEIYGLIESCCGARLLPTYTRIGGLAVDVPPNFLENSQRLVNMLPKFIDDVEKLVDRNKIFLDRVHGIQPPVGETYFQVEGGNGELGFYIVSDGTKNPYRVRCRPPCFAIYQAFGRMITGQTIPDAVAALGSLNIIAGELDH